MALDPILQGAEVLSEGRWELGYLALARSGGREMLVLKPETYMNDSGRAVAAVIGAYGLPPGNLILIHDDIDIPLGEVRVKTGGGSAGHRGVSSVVDSVGGTGFTRVRIGVGRPPEGVDPAVYVLSDFSEEERPIARDAAVRAAGEAIALAGDIADARES